ncbi:mechanosensitive ion channel family protein [Gephyromycinifex aptenodytis]|uniref:mechanosensitive ion channel family protein n=1 Tax=Gephyromycinifex aptenodytis TaxID=2716227 RepID=UPI00144685DE|nr:mechanosensitive ion channel domain-containing protein [Gephyromycinifex aptenodytis]
MITVDLPPVTWAGAGLGLSAVAAGVVLSLIARFAVRHLLLWRGRGPASAAVFGRLAAWLVVAVGILAGLTIMFPSVKPVDILGGVGVVSIAAGIAFQTVLGNMFAGIVLLARDRFRVGDQVSVGDHRGTIVSMGLTSSAIRTFDGRLVLIPNAVLHSQMVTVQTGFEQVRTSVGLDVDDATDLRRACQVAEQAMLDEPLVMDTPAPRALLTEIGTTTVHIELRFWSGATQLETREATHEVIARVLAAFREHGVPTGSDVIVIEPGTRFERILTQDEARNPRA